MADYFEEQRRRAREKEQRLKNEARDMSTAELHRSLSWQSTLADHYAEIGESSDSSGKAEIIRDELRRRGAV